MSDNNRYVITEHQLALLLIATHGKYKSHQDRAKAIVKNLQQVQDSNAVVKKLGEALGYW